MSRLFCFIEHTGEQSKADEAPAEVRFFILFYLFVYLFFYAVK